MTDQDQEPEVRNCRFFEPKRSRMFGHSGREGDVRFVKPLSEDEYTRLQAKFRRQREQLKAQKEATVEQAPKPEPEPEPEPEQPVMHPVD